MKFWYFVKKYLFKSVKQPFKQDLSKGKEGTVVIGDHDLRTKDESEQIVEMKSFIIHENYNSNNFANDICLIKDHF